MRLLLLLGKMGPLQQERTIIMRSVYTIGFVGSSW